MIKEKLPHLMALYYKIYVAHAVQNAPRVFLEIMVPRRGILLYICEELFFKAACAAELGEPCPASRCRV